ncbi:MAG: hypothetical protein ACOYOA_15765 [Saprospiraceae bacterium]
MKHSIENLLREKPFHLLNNSERSRVLAEMSEEEYTAQYFGFLAAKEMDRQFPFKGPSLQTKEVLLKAMQRKQSGRSWLMLPALGIAASLLLFFAYYAWNYQSSRVQTAVKAPLPEIAPKTSTVAKSELAPIQPVKHKKNPQLLYDKSATEDYQLAGPDEILATLHRNTEELSWQEELEELPPLPLVLQCE